MEKKYCWACGEKLTEEKLRTFNEETGKRETRLICPDPMCRFHCQGFNCDRRKIGGFFSSESKCVRCGKEYDSAGFY